MTIRRRTFAIAIVVALLVAVALLVWRGPTHPPAPPSAPSDASVDARPIDHLVALSRLYGYVRFFHPSDEAQLVDWDALAIAAVDATLEAHDAEELATALRDAFTPVAPSIQIWVGASALAIATSESRWAPRRHRCTARHASKRLARARRRKCSPRGRAWSRIWAAACGAGFRSRSLPTRRARSLTPQGIVIRESLHGLRSGAPPRPIAAFGLPR